MNDTAIVGFIVGLEGSADSTDDELKEQAFLAVEDFDPDDEETPVGAAVWLMSEHEAQIATGFLDGLSGIGFPSDDEWQEVPADFRAGYEQGQRLARGYLDGKAR